MGATHKNYSDRMSMNTLGWNSNTKKHGGQKRQVRCFLLDRGYPDNLMQMNRVVQLFGASLKSGGINCKSIVDSYWEEFKNYVDTLKP